MPQIVLSSLCFVCNIELKDEDNDWSGWTD